VDLPPSSPPPSPDYNYGDDLEDFSGNCLPPNDDGCKELDCFINVVNEDGFSDSEENEDIFSEALGCVSSEQEIPNACKGQPIFWTPGPLWSMYPFKQHEHDDFLWKPIGVRGERTLIVRSKKCYGVLLSSKEQRDSTCSSCQGILSSPTLKAAMKRAKNAQPHTPHHLLHFNQMESNAAVQRRENGRLQSEVGHSSI
jgi:hypothetical protein